LMARTRKVLHYAISGGGEYLCEFSSLVLMTSLVRTSESGRKEDKPFMVRERYKIVRKINGIPGRKQSKPGKLFLQLRWSVPCVVFLSILATKCFELSFKRGEENA